MMLYFFISFIVIGLISTVLYFWNFRISLFLYILAFFQVVFILYRLRLRTEVDSFELLLSFLGVLFFFMIVKVCFFYFFSGRTKYNVFSRFFKKFIDIVFNDSVLIIHETLSSSYVYKRTYSRFFYKYVMGYNFKYPFLFLFIFSYIPTFFLNLSLFLEVFLTGKLYFTLYFFAFNFLITLFARLMFFFALHYCEKVLSDIEIFTRETLLVEDISFLKKTHLEKEDFFIFGDKALSVEISYKEYQGNYVSYLHIRSFEEILKQVRSFFFNIFVLNLVVCCLWNLFQFYEFSYFFTCVFLIFLPFLFYLFTLVLSIYKIEVVELFSVFYQGTGKMDNRVYLSWGFTIFFFFLCSFIWFYGLVIVEFSCLFIFFAWGLYVIPIKMVELWGFVCKLIYNAGCELGGDWWQWKLQVWGIIYTDKLVFQQRPMDIIERYFSLYPLLFALFTCFFELVFFSRFQYAIIFLFFGGLLAFFNFFLIYFGMAYTRGQAEFHEEILSENCNFTLDTLKMLRLKPEEFIDHATIIERVYIHYLEYRYFSKKYWFFENILLYGYRYYLLFCYRFAIVVFFIYLISFFLLWLNLSLFLLALYFVLFAYWPFFKEKLLDSNFRTSYLAHLASFYTHFAGEEDWIKEQKAQAEIVFAPIIKAREEGRNQKIN